MSIVRHPRIRHLVQLASSRLATAKFRSFEKGIHPKTIKDRSEILRWASGQVADVENFEIDQEFMACNSPIVQQSYSLTQSIRDEFINKYSSCGNIRILLHVPPSDLSPGGYSLFKNLMSSLQYIGISARALYWDESIDEVLSEFKPSVLLTSDAGSYLERINWKDVDRYRISNQLLIGLTASIEEYGNTPVLDRLDWASKRGVNFYYSFRSKEYVHSREAYRPFHERGYEVISVEFGANPLIHYAPPAIERNIDFSFLGSINPEKWGRYILYLNSIFSRYVGFVDGPGWSFARDFNFSPARDRFIYARTKVGLNLHIDNQISWPCELNERTYMLAACGVPQLVDRPGLISSRFSDDCFFIADNPKHYEELFVHILSNPDEAERRALKAQREVLASHTTFHRAETLVQALSRQFES